MRTLLKNKVLSIYTNLRGWRTSRKLIVFESDDWGAIRMPGRQSYEKLKNAGILVDKSPYDRLDCLESRDDFQSLMNILDTHRDTNGRPAIFTFNTVMGNPDFEAIKRDKYERFYHQHLFDSYRCYHGENLESIWLEAISKDLIRPQYHGLEHLNVPLWMRDLQAGHQQALVAFKNMFYGLTTNTSSPRQANYLCAYWTECQSDLDSARERLERGLSVFRDTFGFASQTFIPCNFVFPTELEPVLINNGVRLIQGQRGQFVPDSQNGQGKIRRSFTGQKSQGGIYYSVRNVLFEPFEAEHVDWVTNAISQIAMSFLMKRPAIISTHRVNYTSGISKTHRDRCLRLLNRLLEEILYRWPEVEFITSDQLLKEMEIS